MTRHVLMSSVPVSQCKRPFLYSERSEGKFIREAEAHLGVLQHMVEAQVFDQVFRRVNLLVRFFKLGLRNKCRRVSVAARGGVVGAGVAALSFHIWNIAVLS
jgi:hypothetical protein